LRRFQAQRIPIAKAVVLTAKSNSHIKKPRKPLLKITLYNFDTYAPIIVEVPYPILSLFLLLLSRTSRAFQVSKLFTRKYKFSIK